MSWLVPWRRQSALPDVFRPFEQWMSEFDRDLWSGNGRRLAEMPMVPRADIADTDKEYLISLELPGLELADVDVRLSGNQLTVSGERKQKKEDKDKHFYRMETTYGAFERRFELPQNVRTEPDSVHATFKNGILEIKVAKREPKPTAKITVKAS
ncbi:MAG TPA: Hsp20/alpha crystallin family protein [Planctomycetota bacterium]